MLLRVHDTEGLRQGGSHAGSVVCPAVRARGPTNGVKHMHTRKVGNEGKLFAASWEDLKLPFEWAVGSLLHC